MSPEQKKLEGIYRGAVSRVTRALAPLRRRHLSGPQLVDLDAHGYLFAPLRLIVVGQQTYGWDAASGARAVSALCAQYHQFDLGREYMPSPFWVAARWLSLRLCGDDRRFVWSNLFKMDEAGRRPSPPVARVLIAHFNLLADEVRIARPQVVVFFTGPYYDEVIEGVFAGARLDRAGREARRELARVVHPALPRDAYRTYHPAYLRRSGRWALLKRIANLAAPATRQSARA